MISPAIRSRLYATMSCNLRCPVRLSTSMLVTWSFHVMPRIMLTIISSKLGTVYVLSMTVNVQEMQAVVQHQIMISRLLKIRTPLNRDLLPLTSDSTLSSGYLSTQGDHLSRKPRNISEFYRYQGNVRVFSFSKNLGVIGEEILSGYITQKTFIKIVSAGVLVSQLSVPIIVCYLLLNVVYLRYSI